MNPDPSLPILLDRFAVEDATAPGGLWRENWFVFGVIVTLIGIAPLLCLPLSTGAILMAAMSVIPASFAAWMASRWWRRRQSHRRLRAAGCRHVATDLRSVTVNWSRRNRVYRWTIVAQWKDDDGTLRAAWSASYDYDPQPLLEGRSATVIADSKNPTNAILLTDGLPERRHRKLAHATHATAPPNPMRREYRRAGVVALALLLVMFAIYWLTLSPRFEIGKATDTVKPR